MESATEIPRERTGKGNIRQKGRKGRGKNPNPNPNPNPKVTVTLTLCKP